jgi:hypothetical protein
MREDDLVIGGAIIGCFAGGSRLCESRGLKSIENNLEVVIGVFDDGHIALSDL